MKIQQYTRKPFPVNAVQVSLADIDAIAEWCKGTIELVPTKMLGTETPLPVIKIQGQGDNRGKEFTATLGCYVVEQKGSFRVYKPSQFDASFELMEDDVDKTERQVQQHIAELDRLTQQPEDTDDGQPTVHVSLH